MPGVSFQEGNEFRLTESRSVDLVTFGASMDRPNIFEHPARQAWAEREIRDRQPEVGAVPGSSMVRSVVNARRSRGATPVALQRFPLTQSGCDPQLRPVRNNHMDHFPMRATEVLDYSTTICSRCGDRERLIVKTHTGVVSRCYVCGDAASWVTGVRAAAPVATVLAETAAAMSSTELLGETSPVGRSGQPTAARPRR